MTDADIIDQIEGTRKSNNRLWMDILRIAIERAPTKTKAILRQIRRNDHVIGEWTGELAIANRRKKNRKP